MNITKSLNIPFSPTKLGINVSQRNNNTAIRSFPQQLNGNMLPVNQSGHNPSSSNWSPAPFLGNDMSPIHCLFKCSECQISKSSCEDLEVHIKVEHLNWLPFCCTLCDAKRASDNQIREHTYSHHKKTDHNRYIYLDNPKAKSQLQAMTDRALSLAIQQMVARRSPPQPNFSNRNSLPSQASNGNQANAAKRNRLHQILGRNISQEHKDAEENGLNGLKAMVESANHENEDNNALAKLLGQQNKEDEIDPEEAGISSALFKTLKAANSELNGDSMDTDDVMKNVSTLFSVDFNSLGEVINNKFPLTPYNQQHSGSSNSSNSGLKRRTPGSASTQCASKKRVLGQCSKCNKPVTAGARQMHLFFHLSKDYNTFRFRCKFPGCSQEHYRKDQMENHMSKTHGQINHELMEDRSVELYDQIQQLSMELLGTLGNKPGPTAAHAQVEYDRIMKEQEESRRRKRGGNGDDQSMDDGPLSMVGGNALDAFHQIFKQNISGIDANKSFGELENQVRIGDRIEDLLECQLCHKMIINRTRGLHILHHARNDLGLVRYQCNLCDFKHERSQSVITHGKKTHDTEECVVDTLNQYEDEIKSLWKACFGQEQLFSSESKKKPKALKATEALDENLKEEKNNVEETPQSDTQNSLRLFTPTNSNSSPSKRSLNSSGGTPSAKTAPSSTKKKASSRRFGIRKPQSKKKRIEMAKLREISMQIGGAMYFKKRSSDAVFCEECNTYVSNRLTHHAYSHMDNDLYTCPICKMGDSNRNLVIKHLKDLHDSNANPVDNRSKFAADIKEKIRNCFPSVFVDAPVPSEKEIEQLKKTLNLDDSQLGNDGDVANENDEDLDNNAENESHVSDQEDKDDESDHEDSDTETTGKSYKKLEEIQDAEVLTKA